VVDEGYTLQVITDNSTSHLLHALANGADGGLPLYYLLAHGWHLLFGAKLLPLRLLSSLLVGIGILVLWSGLRRYYSSSEVAIGIPLTLLTSTVLLVQNSELRFYGLFFACAAGAMVLHSRLGEGASKPKLIVAAVLANACLMLSHVFGALYSGASIVALAASDHQRKNPVAAVRGFAFLLDSAVDLDQAYRQDI